MFIDTSLQRAGIDAVAQKPAGRDPGGTAAEVRDEGREHLSSPVTLESPSTIRECHLTTPIRAAGFDDAVVGYAPTVRTADPDAAPNAVGGYVARRAPVRQRLPDGAASDASAAGPHRPALLQAATDFSLVGDDPTVRDRIETPRSASVDRVVASPARGREVFT